MYIYTYPTFWVFFGWHHFGHFSIPGWTSNSWKSGGWRSPVSISFSEAQKYISEKIGAEEGSRPVSFVFHGGSGSDLKDFHRVEFFFLICWHSKSPYCWRKWQRMFFVFGQFWVMCLVYQTTTNCWDDLNTFDLTRSVFSKATNVRCVRCMVIHDTDDIDIYCCTWGDVYSR